MFDLIVSHVPAPTVDHDAPFAMNATILEYDPFLGRILTGRIEQGTARPTCRCGAAPGWLDGRDRAASPS
jgi:predicted membrane GTPase involved in stress response